MGVRYVRFQMAIGGSARFYILPCVFFVHGTDPPSPWESLVKKRAPMGNYSRMGWVGRSRVARLGCLTVKFVDDNPCQCGSASLYWHPCLVECGKKKACMTCLLAFLLTSWPLFFVLSLRVYVTITYKTTTLFVESHLIRLNEPNCMSLFQPDR